MKEQDREIWQEINAKILNPLDSDLESRDLLHDTAREIEEILFPKFVDVMNHVHGTNGNERFWKIICGHWFRESVDLLLNRIKTIENCFLNFKISGLVDHQFQFPVLPTLTYADGLQKSNDDIWNSELFKRIIEYLGLEVPIIDKCNCENKVDQFQNKLLKGVIVEKSLKQKLYNKIRFLMSKLSRNDDAFIINSYLPLDKEFLLHLMFGQIPQWRLPERFVSIEKADPFLRRQLGQEMKRSNHSTLENTICELLFDIIPICYLEGFKDLDRISEKVPWPKTPKFIFTSNNFVSDDVFKIWVAKKVSSGIPYIAGQHGNNYGTDKYLGVSIEEETSDKFLTWGWERESSKYIAAFNFKNVSDRESVASRDGGLLLIENLLVGRTKVWDQVYEFEKYMEEQFRFVKTLEAHVRRAVTVRLHQAHTQMLGEEVIRWTNFDEKLKLDLGTKPIRTLWDQNKLIVHSYDSTGLLETLAANRPTLAFWQNGLSHLLDDAIPDYLSLVESGILHLTPESAGRKVNEIWLNPDKWWYSSEVQKVRSTFCEKYSRTCKKPIRTLKSILIENL